MANLSGSEDPTAFLNGTSGSAYNTFCSELWQKEDMQALSKAERCRESAAQWRAMDEEQKATYRRTAALKLGQKDKKKMFKKCLKTLMKQQKKIAMDFDAEVLTILVKKGTHESTFFGSSMGESFAETKLGVVEKFHAFVTCHEFEELDKSSAEKNTVSVKDIQELFNSKYAEGSRKPNSKMPYKQIGTQVALTGLPEGIPVKKPALYGPKQRRMIWANKEQIKCILLGGSEDDLRLMVQYSNITVSF